MLNTESDAALFLPQSKAGPGCRVQRWLELVGTDTGQKMRGSEVCVAKTAPWFLNLTSPPFSHFFLQLSIQPRGVASKWPVSQLLCRMNPWPGTVVCTRLPCKGGSLSPGSLGTLNLHTLGPQGMWEGPTGGHVQRTPPSPKSPVWSCAREADSTAPPAARALQVWESPCFLAAIKGRKTRAVCPGGKGAPSGEGSGAVVGRRGLQGG